MDTFSHNLQNPATCAKMDGSSRSQPAGSRMSRQTPPPLCFTPTSYTLSVTVCRKRIPFLPKQGRVCNPGPMIWCLIPKTSIWTTWPQKYPQNNLNICKIVEAPTGTQMSWTWVCFFSRLACYRFSRRDWRCTDGLAPGLMTAAFWWISPNLTVVLPGCTDERQKGFLLMMFAALFCGWCFDGCIKGVWRAAGAPGTRTYTARRSQLGVWKSLSAGTGTPHGAKASHMLPAVVEQLLSGFSDPIGF